MNRLLNAELFGAGLIAVNTPEMVDRYNNCLREIGLDETSLEYFHIDGIGWSPEISNEKGSEYYLSHGIANQLAIVITPAQGFKPIYFPYNSFDRQLMERYFSVNDKQVRDITALSSIWLDIEQGLSRYEKPSDLLLLRSIVVYSNAGGLIKTDKEQTALINEVGGEGLGWMDSEKRRQLLANASKFGDLRRCNSNIPKLDFRNLDCFFTKAFGGTFVFRNISSDKALIVLRNEKEYAAFSKTYDNLYCVSDEKLIDLLFQENLIEVNLEWYRNNLSILKEKLEYFVVEAITKAEPDIDITALTPAQIKKRIVRVVDAIPDIYFEMERLIKHLELGDKLPAGDSLPQGTQRFLMRPVHNLPFEQRAVVWHLICCIDPFDIFRLYISDKENFFTQYAGWPTAKQGWVVNMIKNRYNPRMNRR